MTAFVLMVFFCAAHGKGSYCESETVPVWFPTEDTCQAAATVAVASLASREAPGSYEIYEASTICLPIEMRAALGPQGDPS